MPKGHYRVTAVRTFIGITVLTERWYVLGGGYRSCSIVQSRIGGCIPGGPIRNWNQRARTVCVNLYRRLCIITRLDVHLGDDSDETFGLHKFVVSDRAPDVTAVPKRDPVVQLQVNTWRRIIWSFPVIKR